MDEEKLIPIGRVTDAYGTQGAIKIKAFSHSLENLTCDKTLFVTDKSKQLKRVKIVPLSARKNTVCGKIAGVTNREEAKTYKGEDVFIKRGALNEIPEGEYYWIDIIGLDVFDREGEYLGKIENILETGSNDVYVISATSGKEILLPAIYDVIKEINIKKNRMIVDPLDGLIE